jgi:hypothetical protein
MRSILSHGLRIGAAVNVIVVVASLVSGSGRFWLPAVIAATVPALLTASATVAGFVRPAWAYGLSAVACASILIASAAFAVFGYFYMLPAAGLLLVAMRSTKATEFGTTVLRVGASLWSLVVVLLVGSMSSISTSVFVIVIFGALASALASLAGRWRRHGDLLAGASACLGIVALGVSGQPEDYGHLVAATLLLASLVRSGHTARGLE